MQHNDIKNLKVLGQRVKELRLKHNSSLNKFVFAKGGITSATLSRIENGKVDLKFSTLVKIASVLGVSLEKLLCDLEIDYTINE